MPVALLGDVAGGSALGGGEGFLCDDVGWYGLGFAGALRCEA